MHEYFQDWQEILQPWLGEFRAFNLPSNPADIIAIIDDIHGLGFRRLVWRNNPANPSWIQPRWRTRTGVICPECEAEIQALLKSHRTGAHTVTGGPFIFCNCLRLEPSRMPSLTFFTDHWSVILEAFSFLEELAQAHSF